MKIILLTLTLMLAACSNVDFNKVLKTENGKEVVCDGSTKIVELNLPSIFELDGPINLTAYGSDGNGVWNLQINGEQIEVAGKDATVNLNSPGRITGTFSTKNICDDAENLNFDLEAIAKMVGKGITINDSQVYTTSSNVSLDIIAEAADQMKISNNNKCAGGQWMPYSEELAYNLFSKNTKNNVSVQFRNRVRTSECFSANIIHDDQAPMLSFTQVPSKVSSDKNAKIGITAKDNVSGVANTYCSFAGEDFQECDGTYEISNVNSGTNEFKAYSVDKAGNASAVQTYSWDADYTGPTISWAQTPNAWEKVKNIQLKVNATDAQSNVSKIECSLNGGNFTACAKTINYNNLSDGAYTVSVRAQDAAGNLSNTISHSWNIDTTAPTIQITSTPNSLSNSTSASFSYIANDSGSGIAQVYCKLGNDSFSSCDLNNYSVANLAEGSYVFYVKAVDNMGFESPTLQYSWSIEVGIVSDLLTVGEPERRIDIAIVIDNSDSMAEEQQEMSNRFSKFIESLNGLDWRVGIITTSANSDQVWGDGRLLQYGSSGLYYIDNNTPNAAELFSQTINRTEVGSNTEESIKSLNRMLDRRAERNFIRDEAYFTTIIVSDEDERSDGTGLDTMNHPQNWIDRVQKTWSGRKVYSNHSIIWKPGDSSCSTGIFEGQVYEWLSNKTNGIVGNICSNNYTSQLKSIGDKIQEAAFAFGLRCNPVDRDGDGKPDLTLKYSPNPPQNIKVSVSGDKMYLNPYPPKGTKIEVVYKCP